jgi:hypothetical protein
MEKIAYFFLHFSAESLSDGGRVSCSSWHEANGMETIGMVAKCGAKRCVIRDWVR